MKRIILLLSSFALALAARAAVETYQIDPVHSSVGFTIRHFVSKVPGSFTKFAGTIVVDRDNLANSTVSATIEIGSLNTANEMRDNDVKSAKFLDAANFSTITFTSSSWKKTGENTFDVTGDLTLHGVKKEVVLKVVFDGFATGMRGAQLSGWEASTTLTRADFGVSAYKGVLGDEVPVTINIEADLKK